MTLCMAEQVDRREVFSNMFVLSSAPAMMGKTNIREWINEAMDGVVGVSNRKKDDKQATYYNVSAAFDIETTSFYDEDEKRATMYAWVFGLNGRTIIGRTWQQFLVLYGQLVDQLHLNADRRLPVYAHNLLFDWQFLRKWMRWKDVFATDTRRTVRALTEEGIEFRCSYILTAKSLAEMSKDCITYPVQKMVGDLDYSLPRHSSTPLTKKEIGYIHHDALVVMSYIQEQIQTERDVTGIPMTKTGYVRRSVRSTTQKTRGYMWKVSKLTLEPDEYIAAKQAFIGGFTHGSAFRCDQVLRHVGSSDECSAYPAMMCLYDNYPVSRGYHVVSPTDDMVEWYLRHKCCIMTVTFTDIRCATLIDNPIYMSHCRQVSPVRFCDNGKVVSADYLTTTITELDLDTYRKYYEWSKMEVHDMWVYRKGYLPTPYVDAVLTFYEKKTSLKGVAGRERDYNRAKADLNSCYGMMVTDPLRPMQRYEGDSWLTPDVPTVEEAMEKYNAQKGRFLSYLWGVYVTALARHTLLDMIYEIGQDGDYVYADTDSVKYIHPERHIQQFDRFNDHCIELAVRAAEHHHFPLDRFAPKTVKGEEKPLGLFEYEGTYKAFKFLGAKRYMTMDDSYRLSITVSGLAKKVTVPYLCTKFGKYAAFAEFDNDMYVPGESTGKLIHAYIDDEHSGILVDYTGTPDVYREKSGVHLEPCEYKMSFFNEFVEMLKRNVFEIKMS